MALSKERIEECGKACFLASARGYVAYFDMAGHKIRMSLMSPDGNKVVGQFMDSREEAVESVSLEFLKNHLNHDTSSRVGDT